MTKDFQEIVQDFAETMDALRDFVATVAPVVLQRREQAVESASQVIAPFAVAQMLAGKADIEAAHIPDDAKQVIMKARDLLTGSGEAEAVPPEKLAGFKADLCEAVPIKFVDGKVELDLDGGIVTRILEQKQAVDKATNEVRLLHESSLMALTSRGEWFLAQLVHLYLSKYPEAAGPSEPFFSLENLSALQTIDEAREVLVDHKVKNLMRQSFEDWLRFFAQKPKLGMGYLADESERISEVFKRRNLVVHNGGRASRKYLAEVKEAFRGSVNLGDTVSVTGQYLNESIDLIQREFVLLAAELWRKLEPEDERRLDLLNRLSVQYLTEKRYSVARGFSFFAMKDTNAKEAGRLAAQVNYWQKL